MSMILWFGKHDMKGFIHRTVVKFRSKLWTIATLRGYMILFLACTVLILLRSQITMKLWITFTTQLRPLKFKNS